MRLVPPLAGKASRSPSAAAGGGRLHGVVRLRKRNPMGKTQFSALVTKQGRIWRKFYDFGYPELMLIPFENQSAIWYQNTKAL